MSYHLRAAWVGQADAPPWRYFVGDCNQDTLWDLASLTKPMVVVTQMMRLVERHALDLRERVGPFEICELLAHRSGLLAHDHLVSWLDAQGRRWHPGPQDDARRWMEHWINQADPQHPTVYSDLGFILLGWELETRLQRPLERCISGYRPTHKKRCAPTGWCPYRKRYLQGEVHDLNCWALGGVAGHAGLFAPLEVVGQWARDLADAAHGRDASIDGGVVRDFWDLQWRDQENTWLLGWDSPSASGSSAGHNPSPNNVGHLGFTGTSVWIDRDQDLVMVLLTNRVAGPPDKADAIKRFRPLFHDTARQCIAAGYRD